MSDANYMDTTPVRPPPEGQVSNLIDPVSRAYQVEIVICVMVALVLISMLLRTYCRLKISKTFHAEDWLCLAATVLNLAYCGLILKILDQPGGGAIGIHLWDVSLAKYQRYFKESLAQGVLLRICNTVTKIAFSVFFLRLFQPYHHVRIMVWAGMVVIITFCIAYIIVNLVACTPRSDEHGGWIDPSMLARCSDIAPTLTLAGAYVSVLTDFYLLFIPLHMVPKLKLSLRKKVGLSFIFLTGFLATGAGIANIVVRSNKRIYIVADFTWTLPPEISTSIVENNIGVVCYSMPVIFGYFVGRVTNLGKSLSSWVQQRRARRYGSNNSSSNLDPYGNAASIPPHLTKPMPTSTMTSARRFFHKIHRSRAETTYRDTTTTGTYDEPATPLVDYHEHLRAQNSLGKMNRGIERV